MSETAIMEWKGTEEVVSVQDGINAVLRHIPEIAPRNLNIEKFKTLLHIELSRLDNLSKCKPFQVMKVITEIISLGLDPGIEVTLSVRYLKNKGVFELVKMVGFHGWYRILIESPRIRKVVTDVVRKGDEFYQDRINDEYRHVIPQDKARGDVTHAYCVVTLTNGERLYRVLDKPDLDRHKAKAWEGGESGPWLEHYPMMSMKSALQDFAGRHKGLINAIAREALAQDEATMMQEYLSTGPSPQRYAAIMADHPEWSEPPERTIPRQNTTTLPKPQAPRYYGVNPVTGEVDDETEPPDPGPPVADNSPGAGISFNETQRIMQLRGEVVKLINEQGRKPREIAYLIANVAETLGEKSDTRLDQIKSTAWLEGIRAKLEAHGKAEAAEEAQLL